MKICSFPLIFNHSNSIKHNTFNMGIFKSSLTDKIYLKIWTDLIGWTVTIILSIHMLVPVLLTLLSSYNKISLR